MNAQGKQAGISLNFSLRLTQNPKPAVKFHATEIFLTSDNRVTTQEIARVLGNAKVHDPVHSSSLGSVLSQIKAVHLTASPSHTGHGQSFQVHISGLRKVSPGEMTQTLYQGGCARRRAASSFLTFSSSRTTYSTWWMTRCVNLTILIRRKPKVSKNFFPYYYLYMHLLHVINILTFPIQLKAGLAQAV
jgi:hypothetical protein